MDPYDKALRELKEAILRGQRQGAKKRKTKEIPLPKAYKSVSRGGDLWER